MLGSWWLPNPPEGSSDYLLPEHRVGWRIHRRRTLGSNNPRWVVA